jgi:hypothetical protein
LLHQLVQRREELGDLQHPAVERLTITIFGFFLGLWWAGDLLQYVFGVFRPQ